MAEMPRRKVRDELDLVEQHKIRQLRAKAEEHEKRIQELEALVLELMELVKSGNPQI